MHKGFTVFFRFVIAARPKMNKDNLLNLLNSKSAQYSWGKLGKLGGTRDITTPRTVTVRKGRRKRDVPNVFVDSPLPILNYGEDQMFSSPLLSEDNNFNYCQECEPKPFLVDCDKENTPINIQKVAIYSPVVNNFEDLLRSPEIKTPSTPICDGPITEQNDPIGGTILDLIHDLRGVNLDEHRNDSSSDENRTIPIIAQNNTRNDSPACVLPIIATTTTGKKTKRRNIVVLSDSEGENESVVVTTAVRAVGAPVTHQKPSVASFAEIQDTDSEKNTAVSTPASQRKKQVQSEKVGSASVVVLLDSDDEQSAPAWYTNTQSGGRFSDTNLASIKKGILTTGKKGGGKSGSKSKNNVVRGGKTPVKFSLPPATPLKSLSDSESNSASNSVSDSDSESVGSFDSDIDSEVEEQSNSNSSDDDEYYNRGSDSFVSESDQDSINDSDSDNKPKNKNKSKTNTKAKKPAVLTTTGKKKHAVRDDEEEEYSFNNSSDESDGEDDQNNNKNKNRNKSKDNNGGLFDFDFIENDYAAPTNNNTSSSKTKGGFRTPGKTPGKPLLSLNPNAKTPASVVRSFKISLKKHDVVAKLFSEYNDKVFRGQLPADLAITWSKKLVTTAGITRCGSKMTAGGVVQRTATIDLSIKVLDNQTRLESTLLHELCHAAAWLIDNENPRAAHHGPLFYKWGNRVTSKYPQHTVSRCHAYQIHKKHKFRCSNAFCVMEFHAHSNKGINVDKKVCGVCKSKIVYIGIVKPDGTMTKKREATGFSLYVKEHFASCKKRFRLNSVASVMKKLALLYKESKPAATTIQQDEDTAETDELNADTVAAMASLTLCGDDN